MRGERCASIVVIFSFIYIYYAAMSVASVYVVRYGVFGTVLLFTITALFTSGLRIGGDTAAAGSRPKEQILQA